MKKLWSREESKERFPLPISPLGWSLLLPPTQSTLNALSDKLYLKPLSPSEMLRNIDHFVYARKGFFKSGILRKIRFSAWLFLLIKLSWLFLRSGLQKNKFLTRIMNQLFIPQAQQLIQDWQQLERTLIPRLKNISAGDPNIPVQYDEFIILKNEMEKNSCDFFYHDFSVYFLKNIFSHYLQSAFKNIGYNEILSRELLTSLSQGLPNNFSVRMALDRTKMSEEEWLKNYGYLTDNWDVFSPTLAETEIIPPQFSEQHLIKKHKEQERKRLEKEKQLPASLAIFVSTFQKLLIIDEDMRAYSSLQYPEIRKLFHRVSLAAEWDFTNVFFLEINELEQALKTTNFPIYKDRALKRRNKFQLALQKDAPLDCLEEGGSFHALTYPSPDSSAGIMISPGQVTGPALVVHQFADLKKFSNKYILVLRSPNPTYASYYAQCAGIISETGGVLSHGALVAREFQIPMISEVSQALELIKTDDLIQLDASRGSFKIIRKGLSD